VTLRALLLACALALALPRAAHAAPPMKPAAVDPVRAEFDAALAPGLGDSTAHRLERFLAGHGRHPLALAAHFELGRLAYARGDYAQARERFRRARGGAIADEARYWEGLAAFALGRPREARDAVAAAARAPRTGPRRWDSAYLVALSWAQEGRRPEALAAYRALFDLPAGAAQASALYQAQRLAQDLKRADDAEEWGRRLLASYPRSPEAASFRAEAEKPAAAPAGQPAPAAKPAKGR